MSRWAGAWLLLAGIALAFPGCGGRTSAAAADAQRLQARAAYERGLSHMRERQASLALGALREAVALDPASSIYRNTLGLLYLELQRPDMAIQEFQRAVQIDPAYADAHLNLGIALAEAARWAEAVPAYRKAISLPTLTAEGVAYQNLGLALYHLKLYRESEEALRFAISLEPRMDGAYYNLGLVFLSTGRRGDAQVAFRRVRELAPDGPFGRAAADRLRELGEGG